MGAMPATQRMTADEYLARPCSPGRRWVQLVEGEEIVDLPLPPHQLLKTELSGALWLDEIQRGTRLVTAPIDVLVDEYNFGPDLLWYREGAKPSMRDVRLERTDTLTSPLLEGFELPLSELFAAIE